MPAIIKLQVHNVLLSPRVILPRNRPFAATGLELLMRPAFRIVYPIRNVACTKPVIRPQVYLVVGDFISATIPHVTNRLLCRRPSSNQVLLPRWASSIVEDAASNQPQH